MTLSEYYTVRMSRYFIVLVASLLFSNSIQAADYPPVDNVAFVCDKPSDIPGESLWSSVLNANPMPSDAVLLRNATDIL